MKKGILAILLMVSIMTRASSGEVNQQQWLFEAVKECVPSAQTMGLVADRAGWFVGGIAFAYLWTRRQDVENQLLNRTVFGDFEMRQVNEQEDGSCMCIEPTLVSPGLVQRVENLEQDQQQIIKALVATQHIVGRNDQEGLRRELPECKHKLKLHTLITDQRLAQLEQSFRLQGNNNSKVSVQTYTKAQAADSSSSFVSQSYPAGIEQHGVEQQLKQLLEELS